MRARTPSSRLPRAPPLWRWLGYERPASATLVPVDVHIADLTTTIRFGPLDRPVTVPPLSRPRLRLVAVARKVVWEQANVEPAGEAYTLRVPVDGDHDPRWSEAFHRVVGDRMGQAGDAQWRPPRLQRDYVIRVDQLAEGAELSVKSFIDRCVEGAEERVRRKQAESDQRVENEARRHGESIDVARRMAERMRGD